MQKFTAFSILFSVTVLLIVVDLVSHDYLSEKQEESFQEVQELIEQVDLMEDSYETENTGDDELENSDLQTLFDLKSEENVVLSEIVLLDATLDESVFLDAGFGLPTLKDTLFSGLVFQIIPFSDQVEPFVYQWNFFNGEHFIGSVYELRYDNQTASFQGYLELRNRADDLPQYGTMNEVNNYGDSSFYFNHATKTKTVHVVMKKGTQLYAFEYPYSEHEKMKEVFQVLEQ
jgi:hypothetical protein